MKASPLFRIFFFFLCFSYFGNEDQLEFIKELRYS